MPRRNLVIIFVAVIVSILCYERADRTRYASAFSDALHKITRRYVKEVDTRDLFEGAMEGMVDRLDEHSAYIGPEALKQFQADLDQEFGGVGIEVTVDRETKRLMVMSPLLDTPGYKAGMRAGDLILKIDDLDTEGMTLRESVKIMRGQPGTNVQLTVLHPGDDEPVVLDITRDKIQTESVLGDFRDGSGQWQFTLEENPRIGYIRVTSFGEHTVDELREAIESVSGDVDALILDLRYNAGGLLTAAVDICDMFISDGRIVSSRGREGKNEKIFSARPNGTIVDSDIPVAVLVNKFSASASEIVAACLKDHGRAKIVGTRTWGKGTVQNLIPLEGGRSVIKLTTAQYWRPNNQNIHRHKEAKEEDAWGVQPNKGFEVKVTDEEFEKIFFQRRDRDIIRTDENGEVQPPRQETPTDSPSNGDESSGVDEDVPDGDDNPGAEEAAPKGDEAEADEAETDDGEETSDEAEETDDEEKEADDAPIDDPQLRRAIEYIESQLANRRAAA
jgi:carboxyl-terminal processing protease